MAKSKFVYKPIDPNKIKERANRKSASFDSIFKSGYDQFKPRGGDNLYRYLPPTWDEPEHYGYTIFVHFNIGSDNGTYLCPRKMLGKPCPMCEEHKVLKDAGETKEAQEIAVSERVVSWILDREGDDPEKPVLYSQSWTQDRDVTSLCTNDRTGAVLAIVHPDKGYDVSFKKTGEGIKSKYYGWQIDRADSPVHQKQKVQDEILEYIADNPVPETLQFFDYEYLKGVLHGTLEKKDKDLEDVDDETPSHPHGEGTSRRSKSEDEEAPARRANGGTNQRIRQPAPHEQVDEEVDEEAENEQPRTRTTRTSRRPVDEEEEPAPRRARR